MIWHEVHYSMGEDADACVARAKDAGLKAVKEKFFCVAMVLAPAGSDLSSVTAGSYRVEQVEGRRWA